MAGQCTAPVPSATVAADGAHILLLTDRDWTHPQGGGTGTNLYGQVVALDRLGPPGHGRRRRLPGRRAGRAARAEPRAAPDGHAPDGLPARGAGRAARRSARDADVVLEVVNGITFLTPLWLRKPRVALVHHVHRDHYVAELGRAGARGRAARRDAAAALLYRGDAVPDDLRGGRARPRRARRRRPSTIHVAYLGVEPRRSRRGARAAEPRLLYLGRLKQYKRIELLLDVLEASPARCSTSPATATTARRSRPRSRAAGSATASPARPRRRGATKAELYARAWVNLTASSAEGWCLTVMEAATCGTPSAALRVGGLPESIVDGETGLLADDGPELTAAVRAAGRRPRAARARSARRRASARGDVHLGAHGARRPGVLERRPRRARRSLRARWRASETLEGGRAGRGHARLQRHRAAVHGRCSRASSAPTATARWPRWSPRS